ncbi:LPXTG-motif cell wall anchor domain-containing protein [Bacillus freudenreichii]|nr:LPXTG-motif cell wall anchor domain-containing protein [Bacillus freudenreichii]
MRRKFGIITFILVLVSHTVLSGSVPLTAIAKELEQSIFTDVTISDGQGNIIDADQNPDYQTNLDSAVNVTLDWTLEGLEVNDGDTYSFLLPNQLKVQNQQGSLTASDNTKLGTFQVADGSVTVTFHEEAAKQLNAAGKLTILAAFNKEVIGDKETVLIPFNLKGQQKVIKVSFEANSKQETEEAQKKEDIDENAGEKITDEKDEATDEAEETPEMEASTAIEKTNEADDTEKESAQGNEPKETATEPMQASNAQKHGFELELDSITDSNGEIFGEENLLNPADQFRLKLNWYLTNNHGYKTGDTETFDLPKGIKIIEEINNELKDGTGAVIATYKISTDKKVELTFTDYVETHSNVKGWLEVISELDEKNVEVEDGEAIIDPIGEEGELRIPIDQGNKDKTIEKKGTPNKGYNADEINWEVIINKNKASLTNAKVIDLLPKGTEYKEGSLKIIKLRVDLYGNILGDVEEVEVTGETVDSGVLSIPLEDIKDAYRIEYVTTITNDEEKSFRNEATLKDDELADVTANATVTVNRGEAIKKKAANNYDPKTGIIEWEIELNYNLKDLTNVTLKDTWTPEGQLVLVEDSLVFTEMEIDENGVARETGNVGLPEGAKLVLGTDQFEVTGITTNKAYKVTYQTKVKDRVLEPFEVANTAGFGTESTGSGISVGTYYGSKSAGTIDYEKKTIDWKIEINHDEYPMEKISITDTLGEGLTVKEDTINITVDGKKYTGEYDLSGDNPFTIKFPYDFTTDKKIVVTYKTDFIANQVPDYKPTNKAAITWTPEGKDESITKEVETGTELNDNTKNNDWKNGSYNPATKEITWTIYTNYRENDFGNLIIKDAPQGNQKIVAESVVVKELTIEPNGSITEGNALDPNGATVDVAANTLEVNIGSTNKAYKIEYRTSLAGLSDIQKEYVNEAEVLDGSKKISDLNAKVGIAKHNTYGEKSGYQDGKQVHWSVKVNLGQQKIKNLKLEDTISENQEYLVDTIKVYEASVDQDGNATKGQEISKEQYTLTHTKGEQTFTVEWKTEVERAFIVEYSTLFFEQHGKDVTNTYKVTGDIITDEEENASGDGSVTIKQLASGGGSGEAGYLVIDKVDVTYDKPESELAGAVFDLIDPDTGKVLKTATTDGDGRIDFGRLLFGKYELHERIIPEGYVSKKEKQTIVIDKKYEGNNETKTNYRVENYEPVFAIELIKTDDVDSDVLLEGAEFTLLDSEGKIVATRTTDEHGKIIFKNLNGAGTYYVQETKAPNYYQLDETKHKVIIGDKEQVPVKKSVENKLTPGKAKVKKVDAETGNGLAGAKFNILDKDNKVVDTIITDEKGEATTKELRPGEYTLKEVDAPKGYKLPEKAEVKFVIEKSNKLTTIDLGTIKNEVKTIEIKLTKSDSINESQLLKGAEFEITKVSGDYDLTGVVTKKTTNDKGVVTFEGLKPGKYKIVETQAPEGYILNSEPITVEVGLDDVHKGIPIKPENVKNAPLANVIVQKEDKETNVVLEGAEFKVTNEAGKDVRTGLTTDSEGQISITGLPAGTYDLVETKAPKGYKLDSTPQSFEVKDGVNETITINKTFENEIIKGSVELVKVDGDTKEKLAGVTFTLEGTSLINKDENYGPKEFTTDENGKIVVEDLRPGVYEFIETATLDKYQSHWKDIMFEIKLQDEKQKIVFDNETAIKNYKLVNVPVTKVWNDEENKERPNEITVNLLQNGEKFKDATIKDDSGWKYTFTDLDAVDSEGEKYEYTIQEKQVDGYKQESQSGDLKNGFVITNVLTTSVNVNKVWKDEDESARPENITVELYRTVNDTEELVETKNINSTHKWSHTFTNLPVYNKEGKKYVYDVKEQTVKNYKLEGIKQEGNNFTITNVRTGETEVEVKKTWLDEGESSRPEEGIVVELYRSDDTETPLTQATIKADTNGDWKHTFDKLPAFDKDGKAYAYEINEKAVDGYETTINGFDITNLRVGKTEVKGTKTWLDDGSKDRPESITVKLLANGEETGKTVEVKADSGWTYEFTGLDKYDDQGEEIVYSVDEVEVKGYETTINGFDITNLRVGKTEVKGTKTWLDDGSKDRPESITVKLLANGEETGKTVEVKADSGWTYEFTNLDKYDDQGKEIAYSVDEVEVKGYKTTINGFDITNLRVGETEVKGTKTWLDDNSKDRPESITVKLLANGEETGKTVEVNSDSGWTYEFTNLDKYDNQGKEIAYSVDEVEVKGYKTTINGFDITNLRVGTTEVEVTKLWKDENETERPETIKVNLLQNGDFYETYEVTKENDWKLTITDLQKYDEAGKAYKYTVKEHDVPGYASEVEGFKITNTRTDVKTIEITKTWLDNESKDRPDTIEVELFRTITDGDKELVETFKLTNEKDWSLEVADLPAFDKDGKAYAYEINEKAVDGYETTINGFDITNLRVGKTEVKGTKTWLDDGSKDRPESITVKLLANGEETGKTVEVKADSGWTYEFTGLDKYDDQGEEIVYSVDEVEVKGYETTINGFDITNLRVGKTEVKGTKTWLDDGSKDRPESITVKLLANGEETGKTVEVNADSSWTYEFTGLDKYDKQGKEIAYSVDEEAVDGYEKSIADFNITNLRVGTTEVEVTKVWKDENETDRPDTITVNLLQNGDFYEAYEVTKEYDWKLTITDLPKYDEAGKAYEYTVKEHDVPGYASEVEGFTITNTRTEVKTIEITKKWLDNDSKDRPDSIEVELFRSITDGDEELVETFTLTKEKDWSLEVADLPAFDKDGKANSYEINEIAVDGYETTINGFDITNLRVGKTEVTGTKTWKDDNSPERPESITVKLLQNGEEIDSQKVTVDDKWKYSFTDLDEFDENGVAYKYTVEEKAVDGYETTIKGYDITNLRVGKDKVSGTKTWKDDNSENRPEFITVKLLQNGEEIDSQEIKAEDNWKYSFTDLDEFDENGVAYEYTVEEKAVDGYETTIEGYDITNLRVGKTIVSGTKTWKDNNSENRPESIIVKLLQNGEEIDSQGITAEDNWKYSFTELDEFDENGVAYKYTVEEEAVAGYDTTIDGYDITNLRVGKTEVSGTKTWKDDNSEDRPDSIKVNLLQNGTVIDTVEVTVENDWTYSFTALEKYDSEGVTYNYSVKEHDVPGYDSKVDGFDIVNTRSEKKSIEVTKSWKDDNSKDRPDSITVDLLQNGKVIETVKVKASEAWTYEFKDLEAYDEDGKAYKYSVKEGKVDGYETTVDGYDITNLRVGKTSVDGTKTWKDENFKDRPEMIQVDLLQNGIVIATKEVSADTDWKYSFADLDKYDGEGKEYTYTVQEHAVEGYESIVSGYDITNKLIFGEVELIKVDKDNHKNTLAGAEFELQDAEGNKLQGGLTTEQSGMVTVSGLKPGDYQFIETKAPKGYEKLQKPVTFTIKKGQKDTLTLIVENIAIPPVTPTGPEQPGGGKPTDTGKPSDPGKPSETVTKPAKPGQDGLGGNNGFKLPNTATSLFNYALAGIILLLAGILLARMSRKKQQ